MKGTCRGRSIEKRGEIEGKFIGAVTHVLVQDSTRGYGIFIENMLEH